MEQIDDEWAKLREVCLDNSMHISAEENPDLWREERRSQAALLYLELIDAAIALCRAEGLSPADLASKDHIRKASRIADQISYSVTQYRYHWLDIKKLNPKDISSVFSIINPVRPDDLLKEAKGDNRMDVDAESFDLGVSEYLMSEFRSLLVDRMLLTSLYDREVSAYFHVLFAPDIITGRTQASYYKKPWMRWLRGRTFAIVRLSVVSLIILAMGYFEVVRPDAAFGLFALATLMFCIGCVVSIFSLYRYAHKWKKQKKFIEELPKEMVTFSRYLRSPGPLSVQRLIDRIKYMEELGAEWPSALWAIFEDIKQRDIRVLPA